jgi:tight adherence protein C
MTTIYIILIMSGLLGLTALFLIARELQYRELNARVGKAVAGMSGQADRVDELTKWLTGIGNKYRKFYTGENLEQLRSIVQTAGFNPHRMMPILIGSKTLSMFLFPFIALVIARFMATDLRNTLLIVAMGAVIGIIGPRLILTFMRRRFNADVDRGMPDAIDLLVVCSESGMGIESAIERVAGEMKRSNTAMANVLNGLLDDLRILPNRRDAFANLSQRSTSQGLRRFGTMISQSLDYGTPLSDTLRAIADELRRDRITKLEERAHKLAAKLTIPMVAFMLPAMFVVLGGPPFLRLLGAFGNLGK